MAAKTSLAALLLGLSLLACGTGCSPASAAGPEAGLLGIPIPVSPYFQDRQEDNFWEQERYRRAPVLGPVTAGAPAVALDPPTPDEVIRALERARPVEGGLPFLYEKQRNNVRIEVELCADYLDPPRVYPLIGPAQLHHAHYKCTVYFEEVTWHGWPLPYKTVDEDCREVLYIDHDHFHRVGDTTDDCQACIAKH